MKKMFLIIAIAIGIIALLVILWFMFVLTGAFSIFIPNPQKPEITYGEFPFYLTYELDGEIKVIEDTIICQFDGFENCGTAGKYRVWNAHLKSGDERITMLRVENGTSAFEIGISYGLADYYMDDLRYMSKEEYEMAWDNNKYLNYIQWENGIQNGSTILKDEAWEKYKLKIIDIQYSQPIQNNFK